MAKKISDPSNTRAATLSGAEIFPAASPQSPSTDLVISVSSISNYSSRKLSRLSNNWILVPVYCSEAAFDTEVAKVIDIAREFKTIDIVVVTSVLANPTSIESLKAAGVKVVKDCDVSVTAFTEIDRVAEAVAAGYDGAFFGGSHVSTQESLLSKGLWFNGKSSVSPGLGEPSFYWKQATSTTYDSSDYPEFDSLVNFDYNRLAITYLVPSSSSATDGRDNRARIIELLKDFGGIYIAQSTGVNTDTGSSISNPSDYSTVRKSDIYNIARIINSGKSKVGFPEIIFPADESTPGEISNVIDILSGVTAPLFEEIDAAARFNTGMFTGIRRYQIIVSGYLYHGRGDLPGPSDNISLLTNLVLSPTSSPISTQNILAGEGFRRILVSDPEPDTFRVLRFAATKIVALEANKEYSLFHYFDPMYNPSVLPTPYAGSGDVTEGTTVPIRSGIHVDSFYVSDML